MKYAKHVSQKSTVQTVPVLGKNQVQNNAGGFVFALDKWKVLDRFLILGNENGTYYASEQAMTQDNAKCVLACASEDAARTVARIVEVSVQGLAPKNDPAIFALALLAGQSGSPVSKVALGVIKDVCRTGTHLFQFISAVTEFRGWGKALREAVNDWYTSKTPDQLAYQMTKYANREGWTHRDVFRMTHPKSEAHNSLFNYACKGYDDIREYPRLIEGIQAAKSATPKTIGKIIKDFRLVREHLPTELLNHPETWVALLEDMPLMAMVRNLATMTRVGLLKPLSTSTNSVVNKLSSPEYIQKSRLHPLAILSALITYQGGTGIRGSNTWIPVQSITDALDDAFYLAFKNVVPTNKNWYLGVDVSGSMWGSSIAGIPGLDAGRCAAAMSMITARTEKNHHLAVFNTSMLPFSVSKTEKLSTLFDKMRRLPWGGTDCSQPMLDAINKKLDVDMFVVYTDNETWAGRVHPFQALKQYRQASGRNAKLAVVGMTATKFSIADPSDAGMMDVVGFDTSAPQVMSNFATS